MRAASSHGLSQLALLRVASVEYPGIKWGSLDRSLLNAPCASETEESLGDVYGRTAEVRAPAVRLFGIGRKGGGNLGTWGEPGKNLQGGGDGTCAGTRMDGLLKDTILM